MAGHDHCRRSSFISSYPPIPNALFHRLDLQCDVGRVELTHCQPSIYHSPGTPNPLYVYTPFVSPSAFTPQICLIFAINAAFADSFDADKMLVIFSLVFPTLLDKPDSGYSGNRNQIYGLLGSKYNNVSFELRPVVKHNAPLRKVRYFAV